MEGYEPLVNWLTPAYSYIEGDKQEKRWIDSQNCYYYTWKDTDENSKRIDGKKYWIIEPYKPEGVQITDDNFVEIKDKIKWLVAFSSEELDEDKEWNFEKHCAIDYEHDNKIL